MSKLITIPPAERLTEPRGVMVTQRFLVPYFWVRVLARLLSFLFSEKVEHMFSNNVGKQWASVGAYL